MLWQRVLTAAAGIPIALLLIYFGGWWLAGATALLTIMALREFYRLVQAGADRALGDAADLSAWELRFIRAIGYGLALDMPLTALIGPGSFLLWFGLVGVGFLMLVFVLANRRTRASSARTILPVGALALPALFSCIVYLRLLDGAPVSVMRVTIPPGACWLFLVFAACWAMDTAAYAVGKNWGKRKLCPTISPGKTVEGSIAGLVAAVLIVSAFGSWFALPLRHGLLLGLMLGIVGQLGDLAESKLKRWAGVKDSGAILPGHGGILDRFDSLLFCAPMAYYYLRFVAGG